MIDYIILDLPVVVEVAVVEVAVVDCCLGRCNLNFLL